ncbi:MAG: DUF1080 domain-containing protein [Verrucomicrobia bacterium]|nr:DUF1080 domain-containing protein [Verrucomicrobiota bacterium]
MHTMWKSCDRRIGEIFRSAITFVTAGMVATAEFPCLATSAAVSKTSASMVDECFQAASGTAPVKGFKAYGGTWGVQDGVLVAGADAGPKLVHASTLVAIGEVGVELWLPDQRAGNAGLIVKVSQPDVGADRFNGYEIALDASTRMLRLGRHRQNFDLLRDVPCPVPVNEWIPVLVRLTETSVEVLVNGRSMIRYEDREQPLREGTVGLRTWQREARYRNLWVHANGLRQALPFVLENSVEEPGVCTGWQPVRGGSAHGKFSIAAGGPFGARQCQQIEWVDGPGEVGLRHPGTGAAGLAFAAGRSYHGFLTIRSEAAAEVFVGAVSAAAEVLAAAPLAVAAGDWQRLGFTLTPKADAASGSLTIALKAPGRVQLGRAYLQPGDWAWPESLAFRGLPPVLFLQRHVLTNPPVVGCDIWAARPTAPGCVIAIVDPTRPEVSPRTVFADPSGCIYDLNLSLDAQTVFFSYTRKEEQHWHLWRIGVDGSGLRQITDGPFYDVSPCETPDGNLVFVSTRRFGHTVCQPGPSSNLYRVSPAGGTPQCLSMNTLSDTTPQLLPDGRILFMRWEYIDRDLTYRQSLWTQHPDGTSYQLYFGNTLRDPGTLWQARPIPGRSDRVLATFAPHHGYPHGAIGWVETRHGPETARGVGFDWITQEFPTIGDGAFPWSYRDPFPLDDERFLCSYGGGAQRFRLFLHDLTDRRRLLHEDATMHCFFPIALRPVARPPSLAARTPALTVPSPALPEEQPPDAQPMGTCVLLDVYQGLGPAIERGRVQSLRIMEQVRKTEDIPVTPHIVDFGPRAYDQSPLMSYATYYAKRCWGEVPVEADGSAHFRVPALREIYFQACDAEGRELQRMTSAAQLMPGETVGCVGCHEPRTTAPPPLASVPLAARRAPSVPQQPAWAPDGIIDFVAVVQPVLDRHCVKCHGGERVDGGYDLSGDKTRFFNMAYDNLLGRSRSYRQHKMDTGEMLPQEIAKGKPLVHFFWLLQTPTAVNQPLWAGSHASRLPDYLTEKHCGAPVPPADRRRVYTWIDANVPYYGTYATSRPRAGGKRDLCANPRTGEPAEWLAKEFMPVYARRCASCHGAYPVDGRLLTCWDGRTAWLNFTRPQFSAALTAHLAKAAGGRGLDRTADGKPIPMFADTSDADYQTMLRTLETGRQQALESPGPDMPEFKLTRKEP